MIAFKEKVRPRNGKIVITLPKELKDEVEFLLTVEKEEKKQNIGKAKLARLQKFKGIIKNSNFTISESEWYEQ